MKMKNPKIMKNLALIVLLSGISFQGFSQKINGAKSQVSFTVSNMGFGSVEGTIKGMKGVFSVDPNNLKASKVDVCIDPSTINTENAKRDAHLKTEDFFHVEKFPTICIKATSIAKDGAGYILKGSLTMHGVTKSISIPLKIENKNVSGSFTVNRLDHGVGPDGGFMVGKEIEISITAVLN